MRWHGGEYGICPYVMRGNKKYIIADVWDDFEKKYKYVFAVVDKNAFFKKEYKTKCYHFAFTQELFSRWYKLKFGKEVNRKFFEGNIYDWKYIDPKRLNIVFWGDERNKIARIGCYDDGKHLCTPFLKMNDCKKFGEQYLERYEKMSEDGQMKLF